MREFGFELRLCARLEAGGVPGLASDDGAGEPGNADAGVVARQLGTSVHAAGGRIVDTVCVLPGPEFETRVALASDAIPLPAIEAEVGVGRFRRVTSVFDDPPERARRLAERGREAGFLELDRQNGQTVVRQTGRYPDWVGGLVGVENKPDLGRPGDLEWQTRHDASLGVLDYAVVATESHVTRAHLNRLPDAVGVWRVNFENEDASTSGADDPVDSPIEVIRKPERLDSAGPGLEVLDSKPGRTDVRPVTADAKARQRLRIAERAFGKGWRTYDLPACTEHESAAEADTETLPFCAYKDRLVDAAAECGPECPGYNPVDDEKAPVTDLDAERERNTAWRADAGGRRRQSGLGRFT
ncbi:DUF5787 family protein [Halobacterium zhouii]|uniref:DUF5787 family protein n=1 Tax=Halobacterium zhouii TaxID=2902624 RepID=UPI001E5781B1|nr:DUF5787 family protein [Halobacterium zhouii]